MKRCAFDDCTRPVEARGLCHAHYTQKSRLGVLRPIQARGLDAVAQVVFRAPEPLKRAMLELATELEVPESELWRQAGERLLALHERRRKAAR